MVSKGEARNTLAEALSQVVLSQATITRYSETVLQRASRVRGSVFSSAFDLWFAVLERAEAEGRVERLVEAVLAENEGADPLRAALRNWQLASELPESPLPAQLEGAASDRAPADRAPPDSAAHSPPPSLRGRRRSEQARWLVLLAVGLGIVWVFLRGRPEPEAEPVAQGRRPRPSSGEIVPEPDAGSEPQRTAPGGPVPDRAQKKGR
jgi:hypothetical protein